MTLDLTKEELDAIVSLMDAGVKAHGLQAVRSVVVSVLDKITEAIKLTQEELPNGNH